MCVCLVHDRKSGGVTVVLTTLLRGAVRGTVRGIDILAVGRCDAPDLRSCTIHTYTVHERDQGAMVEISQHNTIIKTIQALLLQARGHKGSNTTAREHKVSGSNSI